MAEPPGSAGQRGSAAARRQPAQRQLSPRAGIGRRTSAWRHQQSPAGSQPKATPQRAQMARDGSAAWWARSPTLVGGLVAGDLPAGCIFEVTDLVEADWRDVLHRDVASAARR